MFPLFAPAKGSDSKVAALTDDAKSADAALHGALAGLVSGAEFSGGAGKSEAVRLHGAPVGIVAVTGLGPAPAAGTAAAAATTAIASGHQLGAALAALAKAHKTVRSVGVVLPPESGSAASVVAGLLEAMYSDNRFRTGEKCLCYSQVLVCAYRWQYMEGDEKGTGRDIERIYDPGERHAGGSVCSVRWWG